jgi:hypothetical protein
MSSDIISPGKAVTTSGGTVGDHTHAMPATTISMTQRSSSLLTSSGCCGPTMASWLATRTLDAGTATSAHLNLPYVQLRTCKASTVTSTLALPHSRLLFFYDGQSCPALWRESTVRTDGGNGYSFSNIAGRMIFNLYRSATFAGQISADGSGLSCASGSCGASGHDSHSHTVSVKDLSLPTQLTTGLWDMCCTQFTGEIFTFNSRLPRASVAGTNAQLI